MKMSLVCVALVLCLWPVCMSEEPPSNECGDACGEYSITGYQCAQKNQCFEKDEAESAACIQQCMANFNQCLHVCMTHQESLMATCNTRCRDASILDIFCESNCFKKEFKAEYAEELPEVPEPEDVGIWQGVPLLGDDDSAEDDEFENEIFDKRDWSWEEESWDNDDDDIFDPWFRR